MFAWYRYLHTDLHWESNPKPFPDLQIFNPVPDSLHHVLPYKRFRDTDISLAFSAYPGMFCLFSPLQPSRYTAMLGLLSSLAAILNYGLLTLFWKPAGESGPKNSERLPIWYFKWCIVQCRALSYSIEFTPNGKKVELFVAVNISRESQELNVMSDGSY